MNTYAVVQDRQAVPGEVVVRVRQIDDDSIGFRPGLLLDEGWRANLILPPIRAVNAFRAGQVYCRRYDLTPAKVIYAIEEEVQDETAAL